MQLRPEQLGDLFPLQAVSRGQREQFDQVLRLVQPPVAIVNDAAVDSDTEAAEQTDFERVRERHLDTVFDTWSEREHEIPAIAATR